eukprot:scaffold7328_cov314-Pinguiococcus_pyrenoidosus.AAC.24
MMLASPGVCPKLQELPLPAHELPTNPGHVHAKFKRDSLGEGSTSWDKMMGPGNDRSLALVPLCPSHLEEYFPRTSNEFLSPLPRRPLVHSGAPRSCGALHPRVPWPFPVHRSRSAPEF